MFVASSSNTVWEQSQVLDTKISSPHINQREVGGEGEGVGLGYVPHGGHDSTVSKAAIQHWHVTSEEKVAWLVTWIEVNAV